MTADTSGSAGWQLLFLSFALVLVLFEVLRGWRLGLPRQMMRLLAILAAYASAYFGGQILVPLLRPYLQMPDFIISALAGALLALVVYSSINLLGGVLFKRTAQHESRSLRLLCGLSGAAVGMFFGAFVVWLLLLGVRSIGAIADAEVRAQANVQSTNPLTNDDSLLTSLARLKNSVELGSLGDVVKTGDVLPTGTYQTLGKVSEILATPLRTEKFLSYPGAQELIDYPKIVALRNDPEISEMVQQGRIFDLLQDRRLIEAVNDPTLVERVKHFDLQKALEYAGENANSGRAR